MSTFIVDAAVSPDCRTVAIVTMGQENGSFQSQIRFYPVDQKEPSATVSLGNMVVMDLEYEDGRLWVLGEDRVSAVSEDGSVTGSYSLGRNYLKGCSFGGNGFAVLLLTATGGLRGPGRGGGTGWDGDRVPDPSGQCAGSGWRRAVSGPAERRAAGGVYLGHDARTAVWSTPRTRGTSRCLTPAPALLANAQRAWLYLPS